MTSPAPRYIYNYTLGKGTYGTVLDVTDFKENKELALKVSDISMCDRENNFSITPVEIDIHMRLRHPNILPGLNVLDTRIKKLSDNYIQKWDSGIFLPYMNSDLERVIGNLTFDQLETGIWEIALGLHALHDAGYVHLDIKPLNIMLYKNTVDERNPKNYVYTYYLSDFGLSTLSNSCLPFLVCTADFRPPWLQVPTPVNSPSYLQAADIYSLGITYLRMFVGNEYARSVNVELWGDRNEREKEYVRNQNTAALRVIDEVLQNLSLNRPTKLLYTVTDDTKERVQKIFTLIRDMITYDPYREGSTLITASILLEKLESSIDTPNGVKTARLNNYTYEYTDAMQPYETPVMNVIKQITEDTFLQDFIFRLVFACASSNKIADNIKPIYFLDARPTSSRLRPSKWITLIATCYDIALTFYNPCNTYSFYSFLNLVNELYVKYNIDRAKIFFCDYNEVNSILYENTTRETYFTYRDANENACHARKLVITSSDLKGRYNSIALPKKASSRSPMQITPSTGGSSRMRITPITKSTNALFSSGNPGLSRLFVRSVGPGANPSTSQTQSSDRKRPTSDSDSDSASPRQEAAKRRPINATTTAPQQKKICTEGDLLCEETLTPPNT